MTKVIFHSTRPLGRCENLTTVYNAYEGEKYFVRQCRYPLKDGEKGLLICDDFVTKSPGKIIMIEHGISGGKSYGLDQPHAYHRREYADMIDYAVCTSYDMIDITARNRGIPKGRVLPLGMPRTDAYFGKKKGDGNTELGKYRSYLFAPTFRHSQEPQAPEIDWDFIDEVLEDNERFYVKPHMITKTILKKQYKHIEEIPSTEPSTPYLIDCDALITDYSTIMLDAHILMKPVILFEKEKGFVKKRKMYLEYPYGYSSRYCTNEASLVRMCRTAKGQRKEDVECRMKTAGCCDGHSTERVMSLINRVLTEMGNDQ